MSQNQSPNLKTPPIFYGWVVVACAFVILFVAFGSVYSFTTFFESLQVEFNTSRSSISLVFAIAGFIYFSLGAVSGQISDRIGSRWVIAFGVLVIGTGLLLASRATTIRQIYVVYGAGIGIGVGFVYVPAVGVVQRWFVRKRGTASGLAVTGIGLGTLCMPLFSALLIHWSDWRTTYFVMSILVLSCGLCAAMLIVDSPERRGLMRTENFSRSTFKGSAESTAVLAPLYRGLQFFLGAIYPICSYGAVYKGSRNADFNRCDVVQSDRNWQHSGAVFSRRHCG
jgi:MFS family permease